VHPPRCRTALRPEIKAPTRRVLGTITPWIVDALHIC
jgi:hypothetical protein